MRTARFLLTLMVAGTCVTGAWSAVARSAAEEPSSGTFPPLPDSAASPEAVVSLLEDVLSRNMRAGDEMSYEQRYEVLQPVVNRVFDTGRMAFFLFGRTWPTLEESARQRFIDWFERLTTATYASRFDSFSGQAFDRLGAEQTSEHRARVVTRLVRGGKDPVEFVYLMGHDDKHGWQVINVVANGVSDLAIRRSQYGRLHERGGLDAVIGDIQAEIAHLENE